MARGVDVKTRWEAYWFAPSSATDLAIARLVFFAVIAALYLPYDFRGWADVTPVFWRPTWSFAVLHLPVASAPQLALMQRAWKLALVCAALGVATRASITTALVLGFYLLGLPHCFGKIHHYDAILIFIFAILACSRCGDAYSVDRWLARRRHATPPAPPSGEFTWPLRAIQLAMALVFFGAGVSKLRTGGLPWIFGDTMAIFLVQAHYAFGNADPLTRVGLAVARRPRLCHGLAATTVLCETGYPLALVSRAARLVLVPTMLLVQLGIRVLLGPSFLQMMVCNVFWVPWHRLLPHGRARLQSS